MKILMTVNPMTFDFGDDLSIEEEASMAREAQMYEEQREEGDGLNI